MLLQRRKVGDVELQLLEAGTGNPTLLLHGLDGPLGPGEPFFDRLAAQGHVTAPVHPGFSEAPLPDWIDSVDDLAHLYLALLARMDLTGVTLLGFSMGAWVAAEIATRCAHRLARLVLVGPVGIDVGDRETRDIPDIFALTPEDRFRLAYYDLANAPDYERMSDDDLAKIVRNGEAAALYLWEPYMHNPKLRRRLGMLDVPTLIVRGSHDGIVSAAYAEAYRDAIPGAQLRTIERAGHSPQVERPDELAEVIAAFLR